MTMQGARSLAVMCVTIGMAGVVACGGGSADEGTSAPSSTPRAAETAAASGASFTAADLEAYGKGMAREIAAVRDAEKAEAAATDGASRGRAMQMKWDTATIPQGAEAAGLPVERYRAIREAVNEVFKTLDFQGKIDGPMQIDLSRVDEATKTRVARDPFTDLTPEAAAALRTAMDRLVPIWIEYVKLTAVAG
jgi:hypothetical protein